MPLARTAMYAKGVELYLAPTADAHDAWQATIRHIALEGRCFVLACNQYVTKAMYPADLGPKPSPLERQPEGLMPGRQRNHLPARRLSRRTLFGQEGILCADLDLDAIAGAKFDFDPIGHYARPDVFTLTVDERPHGARS
ncbi:MAG: nitrilase-related carbon-nitrogen hydrolase [Thermomicrobiales bacterium]